jgi:2-dehydropantoate 2-reductase
MTAIIVFGAGAIGGFVGARLALAGHTVRLVGRAAMVERVCAHGLRLALPDGQALVAREGVSAHLDLPAALAGGADWLILAVKSYDTPDALAALAAAGPDLPPVLSLQNGVGNEEALAGRLGAQRVLAGSITSPVSVTAPGEIVLERARGGTGLAAVDPEQSAVLGRCAELFATSGLPARPYRDYRAMKWSKLLMNMIANALPAILKCAPADVLDDPDLFAVEAAALREALAVMRALGVAVVGLPGYPVHWLARALRLLPLVLLRPVLRPIVAGSRGRKPPSLQLDLARGRSEIEWLNGAVARAGASLGVPTPVNRALVELLGERLAAGSSREARPVAALDGAVRALARAGAR